MAGVIVIGSSVNNVPQKRDTIRHVHMERQRRMPASQRTAVTVNIYTAPNTLATQYKSKWHYEKGCNDKNTVELARNKAFSRSFCEIYGVTFVSAQNDWCYQSWCYNNAELALLLGVVWENRTRIFSHSISLKYR